MERKTSNKIVYYVICVVAIALEIAIDQITKFWAFSTVTGEKPLLGRLFTLNLSYNEVASLGIGSSLKHPNIVFFVITVLGLPLFCYLLIQSRTRSWWGKVGNVMCIGGTVGNAIDRFIIQTDGEFFGGKVRDFMSWNISPKKINGQIVWTTLYTNNIADDFLVVGIVLVVLAIMFFDKDSFVNTLKQERLERLSKTDVIKDTSDEKD